MRFLTKIQSFSDVITNSSSEIFCNATDTEILVKLIDSILKVAGSKYKCEDLFEIDIYPTNLSIYDYDKYYLDKAKELRETDKDIDEWLSEYYKLSYSDRVINKIAEKLINYYDAKTPETLARERDIFINYNYKITAKNHSDAAKIQKLVNSLFEAQEKYDY